MRNSKDSLYKIEKAPHVSLALVNEDKSHEERGGRVSEYFSIEIGKTPEEVKQLNVHNEIDESLTPFKLKI